MNLEHTCAEVEELLYTKMNNQLICFTYSYILLLLAILWTCNLYYNLEKSYIDLVNSKNIKSTDSSESDSDSDSDSSINTRLNRSLSLKINRINLTKELKYLEDLKESKTLVLYELKYLQDIKIKKTHVIDELKLQTSKNNVIKDLEKYNLDKQNLINELKINHNKENLLDELKYLEQLRLSKTNVIEELESIEQLKKQKLEVLNQIKQLNDSDENDVVNLETKDCIDNDSIYSSFTNLFTKEKTN